MQVMRASTNSRRPWTPLGSDIDGEAADDNSGWSVSLRLGRDDSCRGARYNDGTGTNAGHVRVHRWSGGSWTQLGADIDGESTDDESGVSVSLSSDGTVLAVGAYGNDGTGSNAGHVRVYEWSGGSWTQLGSDIDGEAAGDSSGHSVSLSADGTILAVGANYNSDTGTYAGHVRVHQFSGGSWTQLGNDIDGEAASDHSGHSVSLSADGTVLAVGAYGNDGTGSNAGHARLYEFSSGSWTQIGSDKDGEAAGDYSGWSVALSDYGNRVAVGAILNSGTGFRAGHVRVYELVGRLPSSGATPAPDAGPRVTLSVDGDTPHLRWQADATTFVDVALPVAVAPSTAYKIAVTYDPTAYNAGSGTEPDVGAGPQDDRALKVYVGVDGGPLLLPEIASAEDAWPPAVQPALIVAPLTAGSSLSMDALSGWRGYDVTHAWSLVFSDLVVTQDDTIMQWDVYPAAHGQISWRDWQHPI